MRKPDSPQSQAVRRVGVELAPGDITVRESMRAPMSGVDMVVHNAAAYQLGADSSEKQSMRLANVDGTDNVLSLAHGPKIPRTIYVSTVLATGETGTEMRDETYRRQHPCRSNYEQTNMEAHEAAGRYRERGLPLIIVCPGPVIGVNDNSVWGYFQRMYINRIPPPHGMGAQIDLLLRFGGGSG